MKQTLASLIVLASLAIMPFHAASAAGKAVEPPEQNWSFKGITGTYDRAELQRGFKVYKEVCSACHGMKLLSYRHLVDIGFSEDEVKAIAAQYTVMDGPNDDGEMFERPARPADRFKSPYANDKAARAANNGALPPDMSLIVKARSDGADYIFALLTGYKEAPADVVVPEGMYWNEYYPGHLIAMAPPIMADQVTYDDRTIPTLEQQARDVTAFLKWASEPHMEARKQMGVKVILFLIVFAGLLYAAKRKIWADVH